MMPWVEDELRWFFEQGDAEMGLSSSWGPLADRALSPVDGGQRSDPMTDRRLDAAHRHGIITATLGDLRGIHRQVIFARHHTGKTLPIELRVTFDKLAGVVSMTCAARAMGDRDKLCRAINQGHRAIITIVTAEARVLVTRAYAAYAGARMLMEKEPRYAHFTQRRSWQNSRA